MNGENPQMERHTLSTRTIVAPTDPPRPQLGDGFVLNGHLYSIIRKGNLPGDLIIRWKGLVTGE